MVVLAACDASADRAAPSQPSLSSLVPSLAFDPARCPGALRAPLDALQAALNGLEAAVRNLAGAPNADTVAAAQAALSQVKVAGQDLAAALKQSCPKVSPAPSR